MKVPNYQQFILILAVLLIASGCKEEATIPEDPEEEMEEELPENELFQLNFDTLTFHVDSLGFRIDSMEYITIFTDDFNTVLSYYEQTTANATAKEYGPEALQRGHLVRLWSYSWNYSYFDEWIQAFWVVPTGESYLEQAGRSAHTGNYRLIARREIPTGLSRYEIRFRMQKNDNDAVFFHFGTDENGDGGIRWGYNSQVPDTDDTSSPNLYTRGAFGEHEILGQAKNGIWVNHLMIVYPEQDAIQWYIDEELVLQDTSRQWGVPEGGHFALSQHYERGTRYDDFSIVGYVEE